MQRKCNNVVNLFDSLEFFFTSDPLFSAKKQHWMPEFFSEFTYLPENWNHCAAEPHAGPQARLLDSLELSFRFAFPACMRPVQDESPSCPGTSTAQRTLTRFIQTIQDQATREQSMQHSGLGSIHRADVRMFSSRTRVSQVFCTELQIWRQDNCLEPCW